MAPPHPETAAVGPSGQAAAATGVWQDVNQLPVEGAAVYAPLILHFDRLARIHMSMCSVRMTGGSKVQSELPVRRSGGERPRRSTALYLALHPTLEQMCSIVSSRGAPKPVAGTQWGGRPP